MRFGCPTVRGRIVAENESGSPSLFRTLLLIAYFRPQGSPNHADSNAKGVPCVRVRSASLGSDAVTTKMRANSPIWPHTAHCCRDGHLDRARPWGEGLA